MILSRSLKLTLLTMQLAACVYLCWEGDWWGFTVPPYFVERNTGCHSLLFGSTQVIHCSHRFLLNTSWAAVVWPTITMFCVQFLLNTSWAAAVWPTITVFCVQFLLNTSWAAAVWPTITMCSVFSFVNVSQECQDWSICRTDTREFELRKVNEHFMMTYWLIKPVRRPESSSANKVYTD